MPFGTEQAEGLLRRAGVYRLPSRPAALLIAAALLMALWAAWSAFGVSEGDDFPNGGASAAPEASVGTGSSVGISKDTEEIVCVHVVGAVRRPGVYNVPSGSRVRDAIAAAGGPVGSAASDALNLARILADGEQIVLPTQDEWERTAPGGVTAAAAGGGAGGTGLRIDLNTADEATLETLPGIGPATARKIVEDRRSNGPFVRVEDLTRVAGIGEKRLQTLKDLVVVR